MNFKLKETASMFSALGDETRLHLVSTLCKKGPQSITQLAEGEKITRQAVTKHLETLKSAGLANCRQSGREKIWDLDKKRIQVARDYLDSVEERWDVALNRLKALVEKD